LILDLKGLRVYFYDQADKRFIRAVEDVRFSVKNRSILGIVGESGCGKTVTALSLMGLIYTDPGIINGDFFFEPKDQAMVLIENAIRKGIKKKSGYRRGNMLNLFYGLESHVYYENHPFTIVKNSEKWLRRNDRIMEHVRGDNISMVFQNPKESLSPFLTVGSQLERTIKKFHKLDNKNEIKDKANELLSSVGLYRPKVIMDLYPGSLSVGMAQRIIIAVALSSKPRLLIADEPTTGLDTTNRYRIIDLFQSLMEKMNLTLIFISHNIGAIRLIATDIAVMYAGITVELGSKREVIYKKRGPKHPYTEDLISVIPTDSDIKRGKRIRAISGTVPNNKLSIKGCPYLERCRYPAIDFYLRRKCKNILPEFAEVSKGHFIRCHIYS